MKPALRKQIIAEWRGYTEPRPRPVRPSDMGTLVQQVMNRLGLKERVHEEEARKAWPGMVGPFLAEHSRPSKLRDGILYIQVLQPTIRYELESRLKREITRKMKTLLGSKAVREIRFQIR